MELAKVNKIVNYYLEINLIIGIIICKDLKPLLAGSKMFEYMSKKFVMVNTLDDEEPTDSVYAPDGGYIPRILFFNSEGELQEDIINEGGNDRYKYFYSNAESGIYANCFSFG